MVSKIISIIIFFIALAFTIYGAIQLFGPDGSVYRYQEAIEEHKIAEQELAEANRELEEAKDNLRETIANQSS